MKWYVNFFGYWHEANEFLNKEGYSSYHHVQDLLAKRVFGALQQKLFMAHYYGIFVVWQGKWRPLWQGKGEVLACEAPWAPRASFTPQSIFLYAHAAGNMWNQPVPIKNEDRRDCTSAVGN